MLSSRRVMSSGAAQLILCFSSLTDWPEDSKRIRLIICLIFLGETTHFHMYMIRRVVQVISSLATHKEGPIRLLIYVYQLASVDLCFRGTVQASKCTDVQVSNLREIGA